MKLYVALGIGISGCGGVPFTLALTDAGLEASFSLDAPSHVDAADREKFDAKEVDSSTDRQSPFGDVDATDAGADGGVTEAEAEASTCTSYPPSLCGSFNVPKYVFGPDCTIIVNTPTACTCKETYNCRCFESHGMICSPPLGSRFTCVDVDGGYPEVTCR